MMDLSMDRTYHHGTESTNKVCIKWRKAKMTLENKKGKSITKL